MPEKLASILVVDDEPDMCWALENILRPSGWVVTSTTQGTKALELLTANDYKLVFVDAKLPDLDGLELAAYIRRRNPETTIVLISGYFYQEDPAIADGLANHLFYGFIAKPFNLDKVRALARQAMAQAD